VDFTYPLSSQNLHTRYDPVFAALKKGLSVNLIGLPLSARSGYLKFILEYDRNFLRTFIDPETYHFVILDNPDLSADQLVASLAAQIIAQNFVPNQLKQELENRLKIADPHLTLISIKSALSAVYPAKKLVIILYETEKILKDRPQSITFLAQIWNHNRNQPHSQVSFIFIGSPLLLETKLNPPWLPIRPALEEQTVFFPLFDHQELTYLRHRLEFLSRNSIPNAIHKIAARLSAGHTVLYRLLSHLSLSELNQLSVTHSHPAVSGILSEIWAGFPYLTRQNYRPGCEYFIPLLPPPIHTTEVISPTTSLPSLTSQQKLIFDFLSSRPGLVVNREEVAHCLWGKLWQEKYSDWAIDQAVSKLKKKLIGSRFSLLTLRNRGYQLTTS
jgi:hypothetical protein